MTKFANIFQNDFLHLPIDMIKHNRLCCFKLSTLGLVTTITVTNQHSYQPCQCFKLSTLGLFTPITVTNQHLYQPCQCFKLSTLGLFTTLTVTNQHLYQPCQCTLTLSLFHKLRGRPNLSTHQHRHEYIYSRWKHVCP